MHADGTFGGDWRGASCLVRPVERRLSEGNRPASGQLGGRRRRRSARRQRPRRRGRRHISTPGGQVQGLVGGGQGVHCGVHDDRLDRLLLAPAEDVGDAVRGRRPGGFCVHMRVPRVKGCRRGCRTRGRERRGRRWRAFTTAGFRVAVTPFHTMVIIVVVVVIVAGGLRLGLVLHDCRSLWHGAQTHTRGWRVPRATREITHTPRNGRLGSDGPSERA